MLTQTLNRSASDCAQITRKAANNRVTQQHTRQYRIHQNITKLKLHSCSVRHHSNRASRGPICEIARTKQQTRIKTFERERYRTRD